jgi:hypothetical protein
VNRKHTILAASVGAVLMLGAGHASAADAELRFAKAPIEGRYIVVLKDEAASLGFEAASNKPSVASVAQTFARNKSRRGGRGNVVRTYQSALRGFVVEANDEELAQILADDRVAYVEEDGIVHASATQNNATWGLDRSDQRNLPLSGSYTYNTTASNVHAYIIDTGIQTAKDIGASGVSSDEGIAKVSIVGVGMRSHSGVASKMFQTLSQEGINIQMISTSEIKVSCIVDAKYTELAVRVLHDAFGLAKKDVKPE